jgi:hypothetical protein
MRHGARERARSGSRLGFWLLLAGASACRTTRTETPPDLGSMTATRSLVTKRWEVREEGELRGLVLELTSQEDAPRIFFLVQNGEQQDLGIVDALGRAWRYRAHAREPDWVSTGTVSQGTRAILGLGPTAEMVALPDEIRP